MKLKFILLTTIVLISLNFIICDTFFSKKKPPCITSKIDPIFKSISTPTKTKTRSLTEEPFSQPIRIFSDTTFIESQSTNQENLEKIVSYLIPALTNAKNTINKLVNVTKTNSKLNIIKNEYLNLWQFNSNINQALMEG